MLERIIHRLIFYSKLVPNILTSRCMSSHAGGANCGLGSCKFCAAQRILRLIEERSNSTAYTSHHVDSLLYQWSRLLADPSILPFCFRITGSGGFLHQVGRSFVYCHQMDIISTGIDSDYPSYSSRMEVMLEQTFSKFCIVSYIIIIISVISII